MILQRGRKEIHIKCLSGNLKERDHKGDLGADGQIMLKQTLSYGMLPE
jgi:hypothetical protein